MNSIKNAKFENTVCSSISTNSDLWGVGNTPPNPEISKNFTAKIGFDYLTFSIPFNEKNLNDWNKFKAICELLKLDPNGGETLERGFYGYRKSVRWQNEVNSHSVGYTTFMYDSAIANSNRVDENTKDVYQVDTACFELSGDCCRDLERRYNCGDKMCDCWFKIFDKLIFEYQAKISRFDLCIDLFNSSFKIQEFYNAVQEQRLLTPLRKFSYKISQVSYGRFDEYSLYFGSLGSDVCINIYDKKIERENLNLFVDAENWYRVEFRFRHDIAHNVVLNLMQKFNKEKNIAPYVSELLHSYIDIKVYPKNRNTIKDGEIISKDRIRKWKSDERYLEIVGSTAKSRVYNFLSYESSIVRNARWIDNSVEKTLAKLYLSCPRKENFYIFLLEKVMSGLDKIERKDLNLVNSFCKNKGFDFFKEYELIKNHKIDPKKYSEFLIFCKNELGFDLEKHLEIADDFDFKGKIEYPVITRKTIYGEK